jgi:hypothetical protein
MENRTYEADSEGRITIYPSLYGSGRKRPGIIKPFMKKLIYVCKRYWEEVLRGD